MPVVPGKLRMLYVAIRSVSTWALDEIAQKTKKTVTHQDGLHMAHRLAMLDISLHFYKHALGKHYFDYLKNFQAHGN